MEKLKRDKRGITLVALVVTIVILLILAGVSLNLVLSNNGIMNQASNAKVKTEYSTVKESMQLRVTEYNMSKLTENNDKTLIEYLQEQQIIDSDNIINVIKLVGTKLSTGNGTGTRDVYKLEEVTEVAKIAATQSIRIAELESKSYKIVYYTTSSQIVDIGNISDSYAKTPINWDTIRSNLEDEEKRAIYLSQAISKGQTTTNKDVGIGTDGQVVNLNLWSYQIVYSGTGIGLCTMDGCGNAGTGYNNSNITEDGKIQGTVPQYIYMYDEDEVYPVISMDHTFYGCTSLVTAPEIPSSVTNMSYTFGNCTSLITAPEIPSSVTNMRSTFYDCTSLVTAPEIPSSVTDMKWTFYGCKKLTGTISINADPTYYDDCFYGTILQIKLTGSSTILDEIAGTADSGNVEVI